MAAILPASVMDWIEGTSIDPQSQDEIATFAQIYLAALTVISFLASYSLGSVLLSIEVFGGGLLVLLLATTPAWSFLRRHPIKFLPARRSKVD